MSESIAGTSGSTSVTNIYNVEESSYGLYHSSVIDTSSALSYESISWEENLNTYGNISIQTRSGSTSDPTDGTWEAWKPFSLNTNYIVLESMDTHTNWIGTNMTVAEGDLSRNVDMFEDEDEGTVTNITKLTSSTDGGYAEATISDLDLTEYDYITAWVRASEIGDTVKIGMGESVGSEQEEIVTVDTADTCKKCIGIYQILRILIRML